VIALTAEAIFEIQHVSAGLAVVELHLPPNSRDAFGIKAGARNDRFSKGMPILASTDIFKLFVRSELCLPNYRERRPYRKPDKISVRARVALFPAPKL
jgi:hypothetical protein